MDKSGIDHAAYAGPNRHHGRLQASRQHGTGNWAAIMPRLKNLMTMLAGAVALASSQAQVPLSTACQTAFGICPAAVAPVGAPCSCFGPRGADPGRMIYTP